VGRARHVAIVSFGSSPFFSIAWLYREDYAAGAIRMLRSRKKMRSTARQIVAFLWR